jgi:hypothetical protein
MSEQVLCFFVSTAVILSAQYGLLVHLTEFRFERRKCIAAVSVFGVVSGVACVLGVFLFSGTPDVGWRLLTTTLPCAIFFFALSKYRDARFFTTYCIAVVSIALVDLFAYLAGLLRHGGNNNLLDTAFRCSCVVVWAACIYLRHGDQYRHAISQMQDGWALPLAAMCALAVLLGVTSMYPSPISERPEDVPSEMLLIIVMELMLLVVLQEVYRSAELQEHEFAEHQLQTQLRIAQNRFDDMDNGIREVRRMRHDMKYHINVLHGLLESAEYEQAQEYIEDYYQQLTPLDAKLPIYTNNKEVNILVGYYVKKAQENGIVMDVDIQIPVQLPIDTVHLSSLLGNLWQNALDACLDLPKGGSRYIETSMHVEGDRLIIRCKNSAAKAVEEADGFVSTKGKGHGNGIASMKSIAAQYGGWCLYTSQENEFTAAAVLYLSAAG